MLPQSLVQFPLRQPGQTWFPHIILVFNILVNNSNKNVNNNLVRDDPDHVQFHIMVIGQSHLITCGMRLEDKAILLPTDIAISPPEKAMNTYIIMSLLIVMQRVHLSKLVQNIILPDFSSAFLPIFPPPPQYCKYNISLIATIKTLLSPYRGPFVCLSYILQVIDQNEQYTWSHCSNSNEIPLH